MTMPFLPPYEAPFKPVPQVTPFSYRDGVTMLKKLDGMVRYINRTLVPFVNDNYEQLSEDFETQVNALIEAVNAAIALVIDDSIELQDAVLVEIINDVESLSRQALDTLYASVEDVEALTIVVDGHTTSIASIVADLSGRLSTATLDARYVRDSELDAQSATHIGTPDSASYIAVEAHLGSVISDVADNTAAIGALDTRVDDTEADIVDLENAAQYITVPGIVNLNPTLWSGGIGAKLVTPTHDGSGEATHPSALYFPNKWNGFHYWLAYTPYPNSNDDHEDPNLYVSNDATTWIAAPGVVQPLDNASGTPGYNSDVNLAMGPDNVMYLFWRYYDTGNVGTEERVYVRTSTDGVNWTAKALVWQFDDGVRRTLSPSFIFQDNKWVAYYVDNAVPSTPVLRRAVINSPVVTSGVTSHDTCTVSSLPSGKSPWHVEVKRFGGFFVMLLTVTTTGAGGLGGLIILGISKDGINFSTSDKTVIPSVNAGEFTDLYKATFLLEVLDGTVGFRVFYSAINDSAPDVWHIWSTFISPERIGHREVVKDGALATVNAGAGVTLNFTFARPYQNVPIVSFFTNSTRINCAVIACDLVGFQVRLDNWTAANASGAQYSYIVSSV